MMSIRRSSLRPVRSFRNSFRNRKGRRIRKHNEKKNKNKEQLRSHNSMQDLAEKICIEMETSNMKGITGPYNQNCQNETLI